MKLKKIASVALAGVMAVSMLAGCANKDPENGNNGPVVTTSSVVEAVNNGQSATNDVKVTFTDSESLDAALKKVVEMDGFNVTGLNETAITNLTGIKDKTITSLNTSNWTAANGWATTDGFMVGSNTSTKTMTKADIDAFTAAGMVEDGDVFTALVVGVAPATNADAAEKMVAGVADKMIAQLSNSTYDVQKPKADEKYLDYSYDGNVAMASYTNDYGTTAYFYTIVLNQTVSVKTMPEA